MTKELDRIPVSKVKRASKFISTGAKVGANYVKAYAAAAVKGKVDKENLNQENAKDIYNSLSELKGSALKMAQLLSMDQNVLPKAYSDRFAMAQYSVPPLSYPLVKRLFRENLNADPSELFDSFGKKASNAASMGQVHKATKDGDTYAIKVQYPGVGDSIKSDLKLAKPFALKLMNVRGKDVDPFMKEVEEKLLEEADYNLELKQSMEFVDKCGEMKGLFFPRYFPEMSTKQILTMSWLDGEPLGAWMKRDHSQEDRDRIGQILWDFYMHQIHILRMMHADPHPGNFMVNESVDLGVIDFGCIKKVPDDFYGAYFELANHETLANPVKVDSLFRQLEILKDTDPKDDQMAVTQMFVNLIRLLSKPFNTASFDFGDDAFFAEIYSTGERISKDPELSRLQARGSRHFVYFNRTFFGLYNILNALKANIDTRVPENLLKKAS